MKTNTEIYEKQFFSDIWRAIQHLAQAKRQDLETPTAKSKWPWSSDLQLFANKD
jgi:hypothetical protein